MQLRAAVHQNILIRVAHSIANARWMDKASFMVTVFTVVNLNLMCTCTRFFSDVITSVLDQLLDRTFSEFTSIWMNMKDEVKTKESHDSQQYKFRPRAFKIDRVFEVDKSNVSKFFADATFSEWEELLSEEEITEKVMSLC